MFWWKPKQGFRDTVKITPFLYNDSIQQVIAFSFVSRIWILGVFVFPWGGLFFVNSENQSSGNVVTYSIIFLISVFFYFDFRLFVVIVDFIADDLTKCWNINGKVFLMFVLRLKVYLQIETEIKSCWLEDRWKLVLFRVL